MTFYNRRVVPLSIGGIKMTLTSGEVLSLGYHNTERWSQCTVTWHQLTREVTGGEEHLCCSRLAFSPSSHRMAVSDEREGWRGPFHSDWLDRFGQYKIVLTPVVFLWWDWNSSFTLLFVSLQKSLAPEKWCCVEISQKWKARINWYIFFLRICRLFVKSHI